MQDKHRETTGRKITGELTTVKVVRSVRSSLLISLKHVERCLYWLKSRSPFLLRVCVGVFLLTLSVLASPHV